MLQHRGLHASPKFPNPEKHRKLGLTVQDIKGVRDQPSPPIHMGPTAPSWLPAPSSCAAGTCDPALIAPAFLLSPA